jgi:NTE family protein
MSLVTGEPRSATVEAAVPTDVIELDQEAFAALLSRYPAVLSNLNRILSERLARTNVRQSARRRGEAIALLVDGAGAGLVDDILAAARAAGPRPVAALDIREPEGLSLDWALGALDDLLDSHGAVIAVGEIGREDAALLAQQVDRVVAVIGPGSGPLLLGETEVVLVTDSPDSSDMSPVRVLTPDAHDRRDIDWIGRHLTRTKLGLALGAGGAKGYAHIAAVSVLERAGYTVDYVSGSSIGAFVGGWLAMGQDAATLDRTMRHAFRDEIISAMFSLSISGMSSGLDVVTGMCRETTEGRTFADLDIPLTVMTVDLNTRQPSPITTGPLWEACLAAIALAGLFPPYQMDGKRLVDGLALVPVPVPSVYQAGADIAVSCNIMSRDTLPAWPGQGGAEEPEAPAKARVRMLDTLLEVMDLSQLDASIRTAAVADVVITPRFGPSSWRDFHLADRFLEAGYEAAEAQLPALQALARPQSPTGA